MAAKKKSGAAKTVAKTAGDKLTPATETAASGAIVEPEIAKQSIAKHPSVDANPREGVPPESNQIDFNTPSGLKSPEKQVQENLEAQG